MTEGIPAFCLKWRKRHDRCQRGGGPALPSHDWLPELSNRQNFQNRGGFPLGLRSSPLWWVSLILRIPFLIVDKTPRLDQSRLGESLVDCLPHRVLWCQEGRLCPWRTKHGDALASGQRNRHPDCLRPTLLPGLSCMVDSHGWRTTAVFDIHSGARHVQRCDLTFPPSRKENYL